MNFTALRYEELSLNTFQGLQTEVYDGWILRFCEGAGWEDNCVFPLYLSTRAYEDKIAYCETRFAQRFLPFAFKMTANVSSSLDQQLAERGYELIEKTKLMECDFRPDDGREEDSFQINGKTVKLVRMREAKEAWVETFLRLQGVTRNGQDGAARILIKAIQRPICCTAVSPEGEILGCGLGVPEGNTVGLYDIRIDASFSGCGLEEAIFKAIMKDGHGAAKAYIQIPSSNRAALALYEHLGFREIYQYWYRRKQPYS